MERSISNKNSMTMKKKVYIKPEMKVYEIEPTVILAGSERGSLYDDIPFENKVCDNPR